MKRSHLFCIITALFACTMAASGSAQDISRLYASQAPKGSSYVRVINTFNSKADIDLASKTISLDGQRQVATNYRVVSAASPVIIKVNGQLLPALTIPPGSFNTVILSTAGTAHLIQDNTDNSNDLKAELRFYNTVAQCHATLSIANNGPVIFKDIAQYQTNKRAINPVKAEVVASCGANLASPVALPQLKAGDKASLFLLGDQQHLRLVVQLDVTDPYSE